MAVRWAVSSGSWSSISTWNDGETLGIPTIGDTVYCNNCNITYDIAINLGNGWLRNDANSDYNILAGGRVQDTQSINLNITANCYAENSMLIYKTNATLNVWRDVIITGNCICPQGNTALVESSNNGKAGIGIIIVGNVDISRGGSLIRNSVQNNFNITGNVLLGNGYIWESGSSGSQPIGAAGHLTNSITGNLTCSNNANGKVTNTHFVPNSIININNVNCGNGNIKLTTATNSAVYHINIANNLYTNGQFTAQPQCYVVINGNIDVSINNNNAIFATCLGFTCNGNINISGTGTLLDANIGQYSTMRIDGDITLRGNSSLFRGYATFLDLYSPNFNVDENITPLGSIANLVVPNDFAITYIGVTKPQIIALSKYQLDNTDQYPTPANVKKDIPYAWGELVGQYLPDYPPESVVLKDYEYGDSDDRKTGTMVQEVNVDVGCVTPEDVRKDVPLVGMGVVGSLVVPSADDVREGVIFDNGSVGTLIVQGGGDRLRIADFGYYTNAQSDTYIVDLTEQDKPKFAVAEERVLIEMFPDLDLDNIPDKFFDDLFVKYLKYRLIVEYYRTAGINSTFTPSEPTTEIVNYQNVRNEVWLNSANIYLKAWAKKYPESIMKQDRILL